MELEISDDDEEDPDVDEDPSLDAAAAPKLPKAAAAPLVDPEVVATMDRNAELWYPD